MKKFLDNITSGKSDFMVFGKKAEMGEDPKLGLLSLIFHEIYELNQRILVEGKEESFYCFPVSADFVESEEKENCSVNVGEIGVRIRFEKDPYFPLEKQKALFAYFKEQLVHFESFVALLNKEKIEETVKREWMDLYRGLIGVDACDALSRYLFLPLWKPSEAKKVLRRSFLHSAAKFFKEIQAAIKKQKDNKISKLKGFYTDFLKDSIETLSEVEVFSIFSLLQEQFGLEAFISEKCCCHEEGGDSSHHHHDCGCGCC